MDTPNPSQVVKAVRSGLNWRFALQILGGLFLLFALIDLLAQFTPVSTGWFTQPISTLRRFIASKTGKKNPPAA